MSGKGKYKVATGGNEDEVLFLASLSDKTCYINCIHSHQDNNYDVFVEVKSPERIILYELDIFIHCIISSRTQDFKESDKTIDQFKIFNQLNYDLRRILGLVNIFTKGYSPITNYNIEDQLNFVNVGINSLKVELEVEKLTKENRFFIIPIAFSGIALILALLSPFMERLANKLFEEPKTEQKQKTQTLKSDAPKLSNVKMGSPSERSEAVPQQATSNKKSNLTDTATGLR